MVLAPYTGTTPAAQRPGSFSPVFALRAQPDSPPLGGRAYDDNVAIRTVAYMYRIPITTTLSAAQATVQGIRSLQKKRLKVRSLQTHHHIAAVIE